MDRYGLEMAWRQRFAMEMVEGGTPATMLMDDEVSLGGYGSPLYIGFNMPVRGFRSI